MIKHNRKGEGVEPIVALSIAIAVLAIVGFGFYMYYNSQIQTSKYLPDFNNSVPSNRVVEIIGFDLVENRLKYYDGTEWINFPEDNSEDCYVDFNEKRVECFVKNAFDYYWYRGERSATGINNKNISIAGLIPDKTFSRGFFSGGDITFNSYVLFYVNGEFYILNYENSAYSVKSVKKISWDDNLQIVKTWRDSVLEKPINLILESGGEMHYYCPEKVGERYLVVRLDKEVQESKKCQ